MKSIFRIPTANYQLPTAHRQLPTANCQLPTANCQLTTHYSNTFGPYHPTTMLSAREIRQEDIPFIVQYWTSANPAYLLSMGVDLAKMPAGAAWFDIIAAQLSQPYERKGSYCTIWEADGQAVGHCNVTNIIFGEEAYMHLHLWQPGVRKQGYGTALVRLSLPYFFNNLQLKKLYCAPYALNPSPNKTLERVGFAFVKQYTGVPGSINFEQEVNLWQLSREAFEGLQKK